MENANGPSVGRSVADWVEHWDWVSEKGLMPSATARSIKSSIVSMLNAVLGPESDKHSVPFDEISVEDYLARFRNLTKLSPGSLAAYESRVRKGAGLYREYLANPSGYRPPSRSGHRRTEGGGRTQVSTRAEVRNRPQPDVTTQASASTGLTPFVFNVRRGLIAELRLPADLTAAEAERVADFVRALAINGDSEA